MKSDLYEGCPSLSSQDCEGDHVSASFSSPEVYRISLGRSVCTNPPLYRWTGSGGVVSLGGGTDCNDIPSANGSSRSEHECYPLIN